MPADDTSPPFAEGDLENIDLHPSKVAAIYNDLDTRSPVLEDINDDDGELSDLSRKIDELSVVDSDDDVDADQSHDASHEQSHDQQYESHDQQSDEGTRLNWGFENQNNCPNYN